MDSGTIMALLGTGLSVATFFIGRQSAAKSDGIKDGALATDLRYIKESVDRIENRLNDEVKHLEGRVDELSKQIVTISGTSSSAYESAKMQHKRLNEHLEREHGMKIVKAEE